MKVTFPLSLKVSLWLLLNLLLLLALGGGALVLSGGLSWDALVRGVAGERLQAAANLAANELSEASAAEIGKALARLPTPSAVHFALVDDLSGEIRGGSPMPLPADVVTQLNPAGITPDSLPPPPPDPDASLLPRRSHPITAADLERGRHLLHDHATGGWWFIVRLPPIERDSAPNPVSLVGYAPSFVAVLRTLDLKPWLLAAGTAVVVSALFWLPFVRGITRSLSRLNAATKKIATGDFATRVPARRRDELGQLGESVNAMAARLDALAHGQRKFLGDVAHELGSPLGRLQVALEILDTRIEPGLRGSLVDVREEVEQLTALVNELLAFTRAGLRPREAELANVSVANLCEAVLAQETTPGRVACAVPADLAARADAALLRRALANLVRNALRYAGPASAIQLTAVPQNGRIRLTLDDNGPGVPADAVARLGEPFYRPETARTRETGGAGLGLSIVRASVTACGGEVRFANRVPQGFRAEIWLACA